MLPRTLLYEGTPHAWEDEHIRPSESVFDVKAMEGAVDVYVDGSRYWLGISRYIKVYLGI